MTKQELEKAIEKGESVFVVSLGNVWEINPTIKDLQILPAFKDIYKTKAEAEHYLHHANVTRTEQLPFLTWEEFLKEYSFDFYSENHEWFTLYWNDADGIVLENIISVDDKRTWELTEANFYKAYDECVRLFKEQ